MAYIYLFILSPSLSPPRFSAVKVVTIINGCGFETSSLSQEAEPLRAQHRGGDTAPVVCSRRCAGPQPSSHDIGVVESRPFTRTLRARITGLDLERTDHSIATEIWWSRSQGQPIRLVLEVGLGLRDGTAEGQHAALITCCCMQNI